jgi:hypothetical protein
MNLIKKIYIIFSDFELSIIFLNRRRSIQSVYFQSTKFFINKTLFIFYSKHTSIFEYIKKIFEQNININIFQNSLAQNF